MSRVLVRPQKVIGRVNPNIYGGFVEHLGRCIYGGLYEEGSPLSDARGFREDALALLRDLQLRVLRWPGGNFVSNYHWQDGVGPKERRPVRSELAWGGVESNRFGTDEFIEYCSALGASPYICLNMGTGSLEEALAWVEYCNSERDTHWARLRAENGATQPHGVTWWGLGNEMWGEWQVGAMSPQEYVEEASRWARALKMLDPNIRLVSCCQWGWTDWDRVVIDGMSGLVDLHALHIYTGNDDYWTNLLDVHQVERGVDYASAQIRRAGYVQGLAQLPRIAYDEWNVWYRTDDGTLEERYSFADALAVGTYLNIFVRESAWVQMANLAQMVNAIAPIATTPEGIAVQPIFYPFLLHVRSTLELAVDTYVDGPVIEAPPRPADDRWGHRVGDLGPFSTLDVAATVDEERKRISLTIVNRSEAPEQVEIVLGGHRFDGAAAIHTISAGASEQTSQIAGIESVQLNAGEERTAGSTVRLDLGGKTFTTVTAPIQAE